MHRLDTVSNRRASLDPGAETANALRLALWLRLAHRSMLRYTRSQTGMEAVNSGGDQLELVSLVPGELVVFTARLWLA
jgi:hypothetical protein